MLNSFQECFTYCWFGDFTQTLPMYIIPSKIKKEYWPVNNSFSFSFFVHRKHSSICIGKLFFIASYIKLVFCDPFPKKKYFIRSLLGIGLKTFVNWINSIGCLNVNTYRHWDILHQGSQHHFNTMALNKKQTFFSTLMWTMQRNKNLYYWLILALKWPLWTFKLAHSQSKWDWGRDGLTP